MATNLVGPDGREYHIPDDNPEALKGALAKGYRQLTDAAPRTFSEKLSGLSTEASEDVTTGLLGGAQGATAGLYGAYLGHKGSDETPEEKARREAVSKEALQTQAEHPIAAGVGNVAGMIASPVGEIGKLAGAGIKTTTALGRIGAGVVAGGTEGALFGVGNTVSDSVLGDHELTAEKLVAGGGMGMLLGGAGGGFGTAIGEGVSAVAPKLAKGLESAKDSLKEFAGNKALKAAGATKRDLDFLGEERAQEVGQMLLQRGHLGEGATAPTARDILDSVAKDKDAVGASIGKAFDDVEAVGAVPDHAAITKRLDDFEASLSPLQRKAVAGDVKAARDAIGEYADAAAKGEGGGFKAFDELKKDLQAKAKWSAADQSQAFAGGLKRQLSGIVRDELDNQILPHLGEEAGQKFLADKKAFGLLASGERIAEHGVERLGGNASLGLRDTIIGAGIGGGGNPVTGLVSAIASKVMRERGNGVIARLADKLAESPQLSVMASSFAKKAAEVAPVMEQYAPLLAQAAARGPQQALATHMVLAQVDPHYAMVAQRAGFTPEDTAQGDAALQKAHGIASIAGAVAAHDEDLDRHIDKVLKGDGKPAAVAVMRGQDFGAKRMRKEGVEAHSTRVEEVRQLAGNPDALIDRITNNLGNLHNVAPGVAAALTNTANNAVQYLAKAAQHPLPAGPLAPKWHPSEAERHEFAQKLEVVEDPMSALRHAASGTLTGAQMEAFKAVYPTLARTVADKVIDKITSNPKSVPYKSRVMIGLLTGIDPDGTMGQAAIAANQAAIHGASQKPSNAGAPSGPQENKPTKGAENLTLAKRTAMPSQRGEMREE